MGKEEYRNCKYFPRNYFDYIVFDEFHHAVSGNYKNIMEYFKPKFLLGVMFLRPTQSLTVFLQQLGRGLRKYKCKDYLNVLDFIGNYKKANLIPFLLSGKDYNKVESKKQ